MFKQFKQSKGSSPKHRSLTIENLEERRMMTTNVFLDFGSAWELENGVFDVTGINGANFTNNNLIPVVEMIQNKDRALDHNRDDESNQGDVDALTADLVDSLERTFAPFDVNFNVVSLRSVKEIESLLASSSSNDTYVLIADGEGPHSGGQGQFGYTESDQVAVVYLDSFVGRYSEDQNGGTSSTSDLPVSLNMGGFTRSVAHELGHTFGLRHKNAGPFLSPIDDLYGSDIMVNRSTDKPAGFMRWSLDTAGSSQDSYEVLKDRLGLKTDAPAYITGTGAHDLITVYDLNFGTRTYTIASIQAYSDPEYTNLLESKIYLVNSSNGFHVEGFAGNDKITINSAARATIFGGLGDDVIVGSMFNDVIEGEEGDDILDGRSGRDTFRFDTYSIWSSYGAGRGKLMHDTILDSDTGNRLDFSGFDHGVEVDLNRWGRQVLLGADFGADFFNSTIDPLSLTLVRPSAFNEVVGTEFNDHIRGNSSANRLEGRGGNDILEGRGGSDRLIGGNGNDKYVFAGSNLGSDTVYEWSGQGIDTLDYSAASTAVNLDLATTRWQSVGPNWLRLTSTVGIENVVGSKYADTIYGNSLGNVLQGGSGNDSLYGRTGRDQLFGELGRDYLDGGYDGQIDQLFGGNDKEQDTFVRYYRIATYWGRQRKFLAEADSIRDYESTVDRVFAELV